jgi:TonB dependent receptor
MSPVSSALVAIEMRAGPGVLQRVEGASRRALGALCTNNGPFERTDNLVSGRVGLMWQPTDAQAYYAARSNAYNPSGELGVYGATGTNLSATNDDLGPEETMSCAYAQQCSAQTAATTTSYGCGPTPDEALSKTFSFGLMLRFHLQSKTCRSESFSNRHIEHFDADRGDP